MINEYISIKENTVEYCYELSLDNRVEIMGKYVLYFSKNEPINNEKYIKLCYNDLKLPFSIRNRKATITPIRVLSFVYDGVSGVIILFAILRIVLLYLGVL